MTAQPTMDDHGDLEGLADDDHTLYALADKSRPSPWVSAADLSALSLADLGTRSHADLQNLGAPADDHPQYLNETRHDALPSDNPHGVTLQQAYDAAVSAPQLTLSVAPDPFTVDAAAAGDIFALRDSSNVDRLRVSDTGISLGRGGRRTQLMEMLDATGRFGTELWPDDFSITTATGTSNSAFFTQAARTITLNIPGGGGLGNDTAPGGMNFAHTARFEDTGFLFAAQLLINAAVQVECAANTVGPLYLFLDQYNTYADGGNRTCTQHNALRAQPRWGPNINGGSITQTSCELFFGAMTLDATVGSATMGTGTVLAIKGVTLTAGATCTTYNGIDIVNVVGPTNIRGINSAMNNGNFIRHVGTADSIFTQSNMQFNDNFGIELGTGNDVLMNWNASALEFDPVAGDDLRISFASGNHIIQSSLFGTNSEVRFGFDRFAFGQTSSVGNQVGIFVAPTRSTTIAGEWADFLLTQAGNITVNHAMSQVGGWKINPPSITLGGGGSVTTGYGLLVSGNVNQGTTRAGLWVQSSLGTPGSRYAIWQSATGGISRFDGFVDMNKPIALGGGAAATLGTIGGSGPTAAAQAQWLQIQINGVTHWIPVWT